MTKQSPQVTQQVDAPTSEVDYSTKVVDLGAGRTFTVGDSIFVDGICRLKNAKQAEDLSAWLEATGTPYEVADFNEADMRHNPRPVRSAAVTDIMGVDSFAVTLAQQAESGIIDSTAVKGAEGSEGV